MQEESDQHERINYVRVEVKSFASRRLLHLAEIAHVQDQMRAITERLGNTVIKVGEMKEENAVDPPEDKKDAGEDEVDQEEGESGGTPQRG